MKKTFIASLLILISFNSANAGIATIDVTNVIQTTLSSLENMAQTSKQIEEYRTQLLQLEDQIKNTTGVNGYLWDRTDTTINQLINATDAIKVYSQQAGSLDAWLDKFGGDLGEYRNINCFQEDGCRGTYDDLYAAGSTTQKTANDKALVGVKMQQDQLEQDAQRLRQLQQRAQSPEGRLAALEHANQFASQQSSQLLQIRSLMAQQNQALVARMQAENSREALQKASSENLRKGEFKESSGEGFTVK